MVIQFCICSYAILSQACSKTPEKRKHYVHECVILDRKVGLKDSCTPIHATSKIIKSTRLGSTIEQEQTKSIQVFFGRDLHGHYHALSKERGVASLQGQSLGPAFFSTIWIIYDYL